MDKAFGKAERITKIVNNKRYYIPTVYDIGNDYLEISPDSNIGNFCFFWLDDPQIIEWMPNIQSSLSSGFSIIFWFDIRTIPNAEHRNKDFIKSQILNTLNKQIHIKNGSISINKVYELAENIFRGFTLDEVENQYLIQPYCGFRFQGEIKVNEPCL